MSKKKSTTAKKTVAAENTTVETPVVEEVVESADPAITSTETVVEDAEVVSKEEPKVEEAPVEEVKAEETDVETIQEPIVEVETAPVTTESAPVSEEEPKPEEVKPLSEEEQLTPVTENKSGKKEISGSKNDVQIELSKKYKVKFAQSYFMKICASTREISLFSIIETWMVNKNAYVGLLSLDDLAHIREVVEGNIITYKYKVLSAEVKKSFLDKLEFNTQYAISHK